MASTPRNASGIVGDPTSSQRIIPQSRRPDGSLRKEQRVRPGWTPQEDVGAFRSARRAAKDPNYAAANPHITPRPRASPIPGSRPPPPGTSTQTPTPAGKDTEEDDLSRAMASVHLGRGGKKEEAKASEDEFPPLRGTGAPIDPIKKENETGKGSPSTIAALEPTPPGPSKPSDPAPITSQQPPVKSPSPLATNHSSPSDNKGSPSIIADRMGEVGRPSPPQPQGGRGYNSRGYQSQARGGSQADDSGSWRSNRRHSPAQQPAAGQSGKSAVVKDDGSGEAKDSQGAHKEGGGLVEDIKKLAGGK
ncbi:hypothetical protein IAR50_003311 [Cryptococcus sp. DSM 104548]